MPTTSNGAPVSISHTPLAKDDAVLGGEDGVLTIDVMGNDLGGAAKHLYTVDQTNPLNAALTARSALGATIKIVGGQITYDSTGASALQALAQGETATDTFTYAIQLANGTLSLAKVTVTVTGANDAPLLSADVAPSHGLQELAGTTGASSADTASATLAFTDVDLNDSHTVTIGAPTAVWSGGAVPAATLTALQGALSSALSDSAHLGSGSVALTFAAADKTFDFLAVGETLTVTYGVTVNDGHGGTSTQPVTFVVTGANDAPVVSAGGIVSGAITEDASAGQAETASGSFGFADADLNDHHVASVAFKSTTGDHGQLGALTPTLTDSTGSGAGAIAWSYSADDAKLQYLAAGQTVTETYTVTIDDQHGGVTTQDVSVVVTGANDGPMLSADGSASHGLQELAGTTGAGSADTASATLAFADVDLSDSHTVTIGAPTAVWSGGAVSGATLAALQGALSSTLTDSTNSGSGSVALTFAAADNTFDFLAVGETLTVTYGVTVDDGHGGTSTQPATFVVTGADDSPVVSAGGITSGAVTEDASASQAETASGSFGFADADLNDHHLVSVAFKSTTGDHGQLGALTQTLTDSTGSGTGAIAWSYSVDDAKLQYLAAGQTVTETYTVTIDDQHGGVTTQDVSVVVTGANDAPKLAAGPNLSGALSFYGAEGNLVDTISANNGVDHGVAYAAGHDGQAFNFTGSNFATISNQIPANFTITGWLKTTANSLTGSQFYQGNGLVYADVGGIQKDFGISILNNHLAFGTGGTQDLTIQSSSVVNTGDWVNFAVTRNGSVISLYINGHLEASTNTGYAGLLDAPTQITLGANTIDGRFFVGQLDDLTIYNRALTTLEIQQHETLGSAWLTETSGVTGSSAPQSAAVSVTLTDADLSDSHSVALSAPTLTWSGGALPAGVGGLISATTSLADTTGTGVGSVAVNMSAPDKAFDFLATGETLTVGYDVTVDDGHGGTTTQPVTFVISGTNDKPTISAGGITTGALTEAENPAQTLTVSGSFQFTDADLSDHHVLTGAFKGSGALGSVNATIATDSTGGGTGVVNWTYTIDNSKVGYLGVGQTRTETFAAVIGDQHGGAISRDIVVTISGGATQQLLSNPSFEDGTTGWTNVTGVGMEIVPAGYFGIAGDGHFLDTQATPGGVTIAQTVDVATGQHAKLSFSVAAENGAGGQHPGSALSFTWNGVVVKTITEDDFKDANGNVVYNQLKTFTVDVVGQAGSDSLQIHDDGTGSVGYGLDWVKLDSWVV